MVSIKPLQSVFVLTLFLTCAADCTHALDACDTKSVDVAVSDYSQDASEPGLYRLSIDVSDSCPDDDKFEGLWVDIGFYARRVGQQSGKKSWVVTSRNIYPSKSHRTRFTMEIRLDPSRHSEVYCVFVENIKVTGSTRESYPDTCDKAQ